MTGEDPDITQRLKVARNAEVIMLDTSGGTSLYLLDSQVDPWRLAHFDLSLRFNSNARRIFLSRPFRAASQQRHSSLSQKL